MAAGISALLLAALTGCGPGEAEIVTQSDDTRDVVFSTAAEVAASIERDYADAGVSVVHFPDVEDRWSQCSDDLVADTEVPTAIQWSSHWWFDFDPRRETASLIEEVAAPYVADGWEPGRELLSDGGGRSVAFHKNGYVMRLGGMLEADPDRVSSFGLTVTGPCIPAPQDIREWTAAGTPAP
ncbi:hypothetical protein [Actinotalea sp. JY-7885]|uniref:hypothetical protein n=1 Tax=Actinotalea sp. JY-7885 TaxID=2758576 RepID=UPI00165E8DF4|nr:hypothetical protein [Actinotalea sp. JY-7885]